MSEGEEDLFHGHNPDFHTMAINMYETGGEEGSGFHVFNTAPNHYHRMEVLQRTGAIDITCNLEKVVHGAISPGSDYYATLLVMQWSMQPKGSRRISQATIKLVFESTSDGSDITVEDISFHNTYSLMPTIQQDEETKGTEATIGIEKFVNISVTGRWDKTTAATVSDAVTLSGAKLVINNRPPNRIATWTLSENSSQPSGIPALLRVAVLVSRQDQERFLCRVDFSCQTDFKSTIEGYFKKNPKDDPIIFQPNPNDKGVGSKGNVKYGDDHLGSVKLNDLCNVTYRTPIPDSEVGWR